MTQDGHPARTEAEDIEQIVRDYLAEASLYPEKIPDLDPRESLITTGVIDSLGLPELASFLEQRFGFTVRDEDLTADDFGTLERISRYVSSHLPDG